MKRLALVLLLLALCAQAFAATLNVRLQWMPSPDADVTAYLVGYTKGTAAYAPSSAWLRVTGTTADVTGLATGFSYKFKVRAVSALGLESADSNEVAVGAFPPAPPPALSATATVSN